MHSGDHPVLVPGYIFGMWCIGVYSDDGPPLYYCDGRFLPHCGSATKPKSQSGCRNNDQRYIGRIASDKGFQNFIKRPLERLEKHPSP